MPRPLSITVLLLALPASLRAATEAAPATEGTGGFSALNWGILIVFLLGTTWIGERLKGGGDGLDAFFRGGRNLPWWAVSLSLIATKTSVSTFIAVPAVIFAVGGDLTYVQMTLGFALGNLLFVFLLLPDYYREDIYSPYDFIQRRIGHKTSQLARSFFMAGATMSQGVRLLGTALVLSVITGQDTVTCIGIIALFAVVWSLIGGITTVVWTDAVQYVLFIIGALIALACAVGEFAGGFGEILQIADEQAKLALLDLSLDPHKTYTLWVGIFGCTFFEFGANAIDQVVTQRSLCCRSLKDARKAVAFSALGVTTTWIMALVGLAIVAYYHVHPLPAEAAAAIAAEPDRIFPYYVVNALPDGISGLIIAALFAAGISTLDSALTALSQTSIMGVGRSLVPSWRELPEARLVSLSRRAIVVWGVVLGLLAYGFSFFQEGGLLALGFIVPGYAYGALVGIALLAYWRRGRFPAIATGAALSILSIALLHREGISFFWWFPVGAVVVISVTLLLERLLPAQTSS